MCGSCWDVDTFNEKVKKYGKDVCDGSDMLLMTLGELKKRLSNEQALTKRTSFRIFDKAITDLPKGMKTLSFTPKAESIHVTFV